MIYWFYKSESNQAWLWLVDVNSDLFNHSKFMGAITFSHGCQITQVDLDSFFSPMRSQLKHCISYLLIFVWYSNFFDNLNCDKCEICEGQILFHSTVADQNSLRAALLSDIPSSLKTEQKSITEPKTVAAAVLSPACFECLTEGKCPTAVQRTHVQTRVNLYLAVGCAC